MQMLAMLTIVSRAGSQYFDIAYQKREKIIKFVV